MTTWIRWFDDIGMNDVPVVGGKIDSISLNPDSVLKTMMAIVGMEETIGKSPSEPAQGETRAPTAQVTAKEPVGSRTTR
jgi:hypothetical protein